MYKFALIIVLLIEIVNGDDVNHNSISRPQTILQYRQLQQQLKELQRQQQQQQLLIKYNDNRLAGGHSNSNSNGDIVGDAAGGGGGGGGDVGDGFSFKNRPIHYNHNDDDDDNNDNNDEPLIVIERLELMELPTQFGDLKQTTILNESDQQTAQQTAQQTTVNEQNRLPFKNFNIIPNQHRMDNLITNTNNNNNNNHHHHHHQQQQNHNLNHYYQQEQQQQQQQNINNNQNQNYNHNQNHHNNTLDYEIVKSEQITTMEPTQTQTQGNDDMPDIKISAALTALEQTITDTITKREDHGSKLPRPKKNKSIKRNDNNDNNDRNGNGMGPLHIQLLRQQQQENLLNSIDTEQSSSSPSTASTGSSLKSFGSTHQPFTTIIVDDPQLQSQSSLPDAIPSAAGDNHYEQNHSKHYHTVMDKVQNLRITI